MPKMFTFNRETCDIRFATEGLNGYNECTCGSGCNCSGICKSRSQTMLEIHVEFDWNNWEIPETGLFVKLNLNDAYLIDSYFNKKGYLGGEILKEISIGSKLAIYRISSHDAILYPLTKQGNVNLYSICNKEILATIRQN